MDPSHPFWKWKSRINELTGDKLLSARFMRRDFFQFKRTFKFLVYGNHRPRLTTNNNAVRSRIKMVRFGADFSMRADPDLPQKLRDEAGNILRWLIDGHLKWISNGKRLPPCIAIDAEIKDYIDSQSTTQGGRILRSLAHTWSRPMAVGQAALREVQDLENRAW